MNIFAPSSTRSFVTSAAALALAFAGATGCAKLTAPPAEDPGASDAGTAPATTTTTATAAATGAAAAPAAADGAQLQMTDEVVGTGQEAKNGDMVSVHYVGTLTDGTEFDQSKKRGKPFQFKLGGGQVIKGWDQGVLGMKVGGKRKLVIPPSLGYGARGAGGVIPPNATLNFEVELVSIP